MPYPGLPRETLTFLAGLENDNSRDWFKNNCPAYDRYWTAAGLDLIAALSAPCAALTPSLLAVPKLNASLRRIHRDVRFSKDKRPYDPRLHIILSTAPAFNKAPGVHLVISPKGLGFGAGFYGFEPASLDEFRHNVASPQGRAVFETLLAKAAAVGAVLQDPDLTKDWTAEERDGLRNDVPKGALDARFRKGKVIDIARAAVEISRAGLVRRARLSQTGQNESVYLDPLQKILSTGQTAADDMLALYDGRWSGSVTPAYKEYAF